MESIETKMTFFIKQRCTKGMRMGCEPKWYRSVLTACTYCRVSDPKLYMLAEGRCESE